MRLVPHDLSDFLIAAKVGVASANVIIAVPEALEKALSSRKQLASLGFSAEAETLVRK
jgi:hypothetical protein